MNAINLPNVISELIEAQNSHNSSQYANCFSEAAIVFDEGKTHTGKTEIKHWIEKANQEYKTRMKPLDYSETEDILTAEISGTFNGSPIVLNYHFILKDNLIKSLKITG
jgi:hypothetical protein